MVVLITNHQMASVRLKTQACWSVELAKSPPVFPKGVEVFQGGSMEPLQTIVNRIRDNQLFMLWIIDDGVRTIELTSSISSFACGVAQERLFIHLTILGCLLICDLICVIGELMLGFVSL